MAVSAAVQALLERARDMVIGSPALTVALPEKPGGFTPPQDTAYLDVSVFVNTPKWEGMAPGDVLEQGLLQITVVWPKNKGVVLALEAAEAVRAYFVKGQVYGSARISGEPRTGSPFSDDADLRVPVTISWTASA